MGGWLAFWEAADGVGRAVAVTLLLMSIAAWVLILWKAWVLKRARRDIARGVAAFWSAESVEAGRTRRLGSGR